jgi:hypothetical protein
VKRAVLWLTMMVLFAACENSADPLGGILGGGGGTLTAAQATGSWLFTVQRTTTLPCTSALTNGQQITAQLFVLSDGTVGSTSSWLNPISFAVDPVSGVVSLSDGATDLTLTGPAVSGTAGMELRGTMTSSGRFTGGTLSDPAGSQFSQAFGSDGCAYTVTGQKTS